MIVRKVSPHSYCVETRAKLVVEALGADRYTDPEEEEQQDENEGQDEEGEEGDEAEEEEKDEDGQSVDSDEESEKDPWGKLHYEAMEELSSSFEKKSSEYQKNGASEEVAKKKAFKSLLPAHRKRLSRRYLHYIK